ncbi:tetratricopeptide repeat protein [Sphingobacterium spiritivorum]|uniref:tetratricopeptide repeat protein n=1 Tax=Sphingobacterium spiritivorum TaxID=258 RepID=UPI003DA3CD22
MKLILTYILMMTLSSVFAQYSKEDSIRMEDLETQIENASQQQDNVLKARLYEELLQIAPKNGRYLNNAGATYFYLKDYQKAKEKFRMAVLYAPEKQALYFTNLSAAFAKIEDWERAYDYARRALETEETDLTLFNAASHANNAGKANACIQILDNARIPLPADVQSLYARSYMTLGDPTKAIEHYELFFRSYDITTAVAKDINMDDERSNLYQSYLYEISLKAYKNIPLDPDWKRMTDLYITLMNTAQKREITWTGTLNRMNEILPLRPAYKKNFESLIYAYPGLSEEEKICGKYMLKDKVQAESMAQNWVRNNPDTQDYAQNQRIRRIIFYLALDEYLSQWNKSKQHNRSLLSELTALFSTIFDAEKLHTDTAHLLQEDFLTLTFQEIAKKLKQTFANRKDALPLIKGFINALPDSQAKTEMIREIPK